MEVTVPETAQRFKQGLGRLIRTTEDWGVVTVLDNRLITKRWGSLLMRGIPDFERVMEARAQVQRHRQRDAAVQG
jgi:ATP-dependent DNA helicase DinG